MQSTVTNINIVFSVLRNLREKEGAKHHVQLSVALLLMLLVSLVLVALNSEATSVEYGGCILVSIFVHYFALVAVMWMGAEALLVFQKVVVVFVRITTKYIVTVSLICWCKLTSVS